MHMHTKTTSIFTALLAAGSLLAGCGGGGAGVTQPSPTADVPPASTTPAWVLDWSDEFDGAALDHGKWVEETGGDGWGNQELEFYTARPDNVRVANGVLVIEARREEYGGRHTRPRA